MQKFDPDLLTCLLYYFQNIIFQLVSKPEMPKKSKSDLDENW